MMLMQIDPCPFLFPKILTHHIQYVDDTIIVMPGCERQLSHLKDLLQNFTLSTSFKVNYHKSCLVPINMNGERASSLAESFGCLVGSFPFTYLRLPLVLLKSKIMLHSCAGLKEDSLLLLSTYLMLAGYNW